MVAVRWLPLKCPRESELVVLPAPLGPISPYTSPWLTSRSIPSKAVKLPNFLVTLFHLIQSPCAALRYKIFLKTDSNSSNSAKKCCPSHSRSSPDFPGQRSFPLLQPSIAQRIRLMICSSATSCLNSLPVSISWQTSPLKPLAVSSSKRWYRISVPVPAHPCGCRCWPGTERAGGSGDKPAS